jgi:hypothetical protein
MTEGIPVDGTGVPWLSDNEDLPDQNVPASESMTEPVATDAAPPADEPPTPEAAPLPAKVNGPVRETSGLFLQDLVDAMRQITEEARDHALGELRASLEQRSADLRSATDQRATDLREEAEGDMVRVAEWEQGELARTRDEAAARVSARRTKLDAQLSANAASGETALGAVQARIDAFEREMAAFFAQLNDLHDPVAFASAAKRMPRPPSLADTPVAPAEHIAPTPAPDPAVEADAPEADAPGADAGEWLNQAEAEESQEPTPEPAPEPMAVEAVPAEAVPAEPVAVAAEAPAPAPEAVEALPEPEPEVEETSTQVLVTGLTSFGAITSFKQSLERVPGVRRVSMGLGTSGEFIFTAVHPVGFDVEEAIRSFEGTAQFVPGPDHLRVTVGPKA